jgi:hypothetical protein
VTALPVSFSEVGFPAHFAWGTTGFDTVLTQTFTQTSTTWCWVVQGIDGSSNGSGLGFDMFMNLHGRGKIYIAQHDVVDPLDVPFIPSAYVGTWRGAVPLGEGEALEIGIETTAPSDLAICAWGIVVPVTLGVGI